MHDCDALEKCTRVVRVSDDSSVEVSLSEDKETIRDSPLLLFFLLDHDDYVRNFLPCLHGKLRYNFIS